MVKIILSIIIIFLSIQSLYSQGWDNLVFSDRQASVYEISYNSKGQPYVLLTNNFTYVITTENGVKWDTVAYDNIFAGIPKQQLGSQPKNISFRNDSSFILSNVNSHFAFYEYKGKPLLEHTLLEMNTRTAQVLMYENFGYADGYGEYFITEDDWETYEEIKMKDDFTSHSYMRFYNDSLLNGNIYNSAKKSTYYGYFNPRTNHWDTIGRPAGTNGFKFFKVNDELIYARMSSDYDNIGRTADIIHYSRDGGKSWDLLLDTIHDPPYQIDEIAFHDEMNGVAVGANGKMLMTNDGGLSWENINLEYVYEPWPAPWTMDIGWIDTIPFLCFRPKAAIYTYSGDFFNFDYDTIKHSELLLPKQGDVIDVENAVFLWEPEEKPDSLEFYDYHHIQITSKNTYDQWILPDFDKKIKGTQAAFDSLVPGRKYKWRVLTVKGSQIRHSEIREFTAGEQNTELIPPEIYNCSQVETEEYHLLIDSLNYTLDWEDINLADSYHVRMYMEPFESYPILDTTVVESKLDYQFEENHRGNAFTWLVSSISGVDTSEYSTTCQNIISLDSVISVSPGCEGKMEGANNNDSIVWVHRLANHGDSLPDNYVFDFELYTNKWKEPSWTCYGMKTGRLDVNELNRDSIIWRFVIYDWRVRLRKTTWPYEMTDWTEFCNMRGHPYLSVNDLVPLDDSEYSIIIDGNLIKVSAATSQHQIRSLSLIDISGREVARSEYNMIRTASLTSGIYFLVIDGESYRKLVIK